MTVTPDQLHVVYGSNEWSALYVDGQLDRVGDTYLIEERIIQILNISYEHSDDFLRGGSGRGDVAGTLAEMNDYRRVRDEREEQAAELRRQAAELQARAQALLEGGAP